MFEWISFKDRKPALGDLIIGWDGEFYAVGEWIQRTVMGTDEIKGPYILNETGACCHSEFDDKYMKFWAIIPNPEEPEELESQAKMELEKENDV